MLRSGRPVGEPLADDGVDVFLGGVPVRAQRQLRRSEEVGQHGVALLGLAVAQVGAVAVVDVPVELEQGVLDRQRQVVGHRRGAQVHRPSRAACVDEGVNGALRDADDGGLAAADRARRRAGLGGLEFLVGAEEEQLVLDDRPTQREALGVFLEGRDVGVQAAGPVVALAHQIGVAPDVVQAAVEVVRAALGHGVDVGAGVALLRDVVVAQVDLHRLDRVDGYRLLLRRQVVAFDAECIADVDAVDGDRVVAVVLAGRRDLAVLTVGLCQARVGAGVVGQAALDGSEVLQLRTTDVRARAHGTAVQAIAETAAGDGDDRDCRRSEVRVECQRLGQLQHDAFALVGLTALGNGDRVRPAGAQAACCVAAFGVGGHGVAGAGLDVDDRHLGTRHGLAVGAGHDAVDTGCGVLRQRRRDHDAGHDGHGHGDRGSGSAQPFRVVHVGVL